MRLNLADDPRNRVRVGQVAIEVLDIPAQEEVLFPAAHLQRTDFHLERQALDLGKLEPALDRRIGLGATDEEDREKRDNCERGKASENADPRVDGKSINSCHEIRPCS